MRVNGPEDSFNHETHKIHKNNYLDRINMIYMIIVLKLF